MSEKNIILDIENVAFGGVGIARHEGKTVFVENSITGDKVEAEVLTEKSSFIKAKAIKQLATNPLRISSPCSYHTECGGCQWLEVPYEAQTSWKKQFVTESIKRIAKIDVPEDFSILPTLESSNYRNRILLRGTIEEGSHIRLGFFRKASREQIHVKTCHVADKELNSVIEKLSITPSIGKKEKFRLELQVFPALKEDNKSCVTAVVHPIGRFVSPGMKNLIKTLEGLDEIHWVGLASSLKKAPIFKLEKWKNINYFTSPGQFFQINLEHNHSLRELVCQIIEQEKDEVKILDLFCGSGNLSLALADGKRKITGVEFNPTAIKIAKHAVKSNALKNISYYADDANKFLEKIESNNEKVDIFIVDPPRAGMKECLKAILNILPNKILYVSCDPATLSRDLKELSTKYKLSSLRALDFFPNTYHIESLAVLEKI